MTFVLTPARRRRATRSLSLLACASTFAIAALNLGSPSAGASAKLTTHQACQAIAAALADGPDSDADPVGYALAQITPLKSIKISNEKLRAAVDKLSAAYRLEYRDRASKVGQDAVKTATQRVTTLCPGATS